MTSFDPVGNTFGGIGVLGQLFAACVRAFDVWQNGKAIAEEGLLFQILLEMQSARFKAWGCDWGIAKDMHLHHKSFQKYGSLAVDCINLIIHQTQSLETLDEQFSVLKLASNRPNGGSLFDLLSSMAKVSVFPGFRATSTDEMVGSMENNATFQEKLKWGWQDGKALKKVKILETLIDGLYQILPPPVDDPLAAVVLNSSLNSTDTETLEVVAHQDSSLRAALALLKSANLKLEGRSTAIQEVDVRKTLFQLTRERNQDKRNSRAIATYQDTNVMIEWKTLSSSLDRTDSIVLDQRIKNIARLLRADLKPEELRTLSCIGVVMKVDEDETKYGLLYSLPSPSTSHSLRDLLLTRKGLILGDYFTIANALAKTLLFLHLAGWLHKAIRSDNVLFFANEISGVLPAYPYLIGFDYSRPNEQNALTEDLEDDREFNLYRHPDAQGVPIDGPEVENTNSDASTPRRKSYCTEYDIYSLGVVLLELGVRKTAQTILEQALAGKHYGKHSPERFRSWLIEAIGPQLGTKMGQIYQDTTLLCLRGNFDLTHRNLQTAYYMDVVKALDSCHV